MNNRTSTVSTVNFYKDNLADLKYLYFFKMNAAIEILWVLHEETMSVIENSHINYEWLNTIKIYLDCNCPPKMSHWLDSFNCSRSYYKF